MLLLTPPVMLWLLSTPRREATPLERFWPDRPAAAVRLGGLETAWRRHWQGRPETTPETALRDVLEATGDWPKMVAEHGEIEAWGRVKLIPRVLFETFGEESWLLLGEWGGDAPGEGEAGLVLILPGGGSLRRSVGPLAELLLGNYEIASSRVGGVTVYEYRSEDERRSLSFFNAGGRIVVSLRQKGPGPLPAIVGRLGDPDWHGGGTAETMATAAAGEEKGALFAVVWPERLMSLVRQFNEQRGREFSEESEASLAAWARRMEGMERLTLRQSGASLLDLELRAEWEGGRTPVFGGGEDADAAGTATVTVADIEPAVVQADFSPEALADLSMRAALRGADDWKSAVLMEMLAPGLRTVLQQALDDKALRGTRIGIAHYASALPVSVRVLRWEDRPPLESTGGAPAGFWKYAVEAGGSDGEDSVRWYGPKSAGAIAGDAAWEGFAGEAWRRGGRPDGFVAMHFGALAKTLDDVPGGLLEEKAQRRLDRLRETAHGLALALGGACLRLDCREDGWALRLSTMEKREPVRE
jgi:hypothetical protein